MKNITVLGAGLVGSLLSVYLAKKGYSVNVFERRPDMRKEKISAGRSINLALSDRGWKGLAGVGLADEIKKIAIPMNGRMIHQLDGHLDFQPYGREGQAIYSVSRGELNRKMMDLAEENPNVKIHFNKKCVEVDLEKSVAFFEDNTSQKSDIIFGADGAFSALRNAMMKTDRFEYSQSYLEQSYKELHIPPSKDNNFQMEKNALHIWPRKQFMLIALPNMDNSFTCTLFFNHEGELSFSSIKREIDLMKFFQEYFPDAIPLMPTLKEDFFNNPTSSLVTVKCFPWVINNSCLIGDAAHAIVPFFGQGMNAGFEDCSVLNEIINLNGNDWEKILSDFQSARKINGDAIADLAVGNFIEMRDKVADPNFLLRKKLEKKIGEEYPQYKSLYEMVTFSELSYSEALDISIQQEIFLEKLVRNYKKTNLLDRKIVEEIINISII